MGNKRARRARSRLAAVQRYTNDRWLSTVTHGPLRTLIAWQHRCGAARETGPWSIVQHFLETNGQDADKAAPRFILSNGLVAGALHQSAMRQQTVSCPAQNSHYFVYLIAHLIDLLVQVGVYEPTCVTSVMLARRTKFWFRSDACGEVSK